VLVAADELKFTGAPAVGDEVSVYAELADSGRTSLTYAVEAWSRERHGEAETKVASGRLKFVAMGEDDRPREIPSPLEGEGGSGAAAEG
jgi:acyl-CoA thioesterase YciA